MIADMELEFLQMSVDECVEALNVAEYTATADEPFPKNFHLADDPVFCRLLTLARKTETATAELEAQLAAAQAEIAKWREALDEAQANSGFWGRAAAKAQQEARRLAERCRLLEKHIWHDVRRVAKESGKFDDDAEVFANKAIELLNYAINEAISGEEKK